MFPVAEFYYRVWRLTPETHRFYIPLPKVNSFYNQVALTYTQQQYEKLRHTHTHTHTCCRGAMPFDDADRRGINHTCSSTVRCPNHNQTHYSCGSLSISSHSFQFPSSGYQYILCISIVLSVSRNISPGNECMYSILHTHSRQCLSHTYTHTHADAKCR